MRKVVAVITAFVSVLAIGPAAVAHTPAPTVTVTQFDCESVTVTGSGWEQTEATVEVGVLPPESGEASEDLIAGPVQVFPDEQGNIAPTVVPFNRTPPDGDHTAVVLVDGLVRGQSPIFTLTGCRAAPAPTVTVTHFDGDHAAVVLVDGLVRGQSPTFTLTGCRAAPAPSPPPTSGPGPALPATGSSTTPLLAIGLVL